MLQRRLANRERKNGRRHKYWFRADCITSQLSDSGTKAWKGKKKKQNRMGLEPSYVLIQKTKAKVRSHSVNKAKEKI